jgi:hypothetical protein
VAGVFMLTFALALPLALAMRGLLQTQLGRSLAAHEAADAVNYDWWQEFAAQASGLGTTFTPAIIGFAAALDNISSVLDGRSEAVSVAGALALYLAGWTFLAGGILDRYARQRKTRSAGFFAASGMYFFRFLRLAIVAGVVYWLLFGYVHPWLFDEWYVDATRDLGTERHAFLWRLAFYALFGALILLASIVFDYTKVRIVVEDRRSVLGALAASVRFIRRHPAHTFGLYALNGFIFVWLLAVWALIAPGAGGGGISLWAGLAVAQLYLLARLLLKLHFLASETSLFQASLAHAAYTRAPEPVWPESPAAEMITSDDARLKPSRYGLAPNSAPRR